MAWTWEEMLEAFRTLGGVADNIVQADGLHGRGIFPIDRTRPIHLHVPENLLIPESDIEFVDGRLTIKEVAEVGQPEREFFEEYQNTFSWGGGGRSDCVALIQAFDDLPDGVRSLLSTDFGMKRMFEGSDRVERRFLHSRRIVWNGKTVLMPLMDLTNHEPTASRFNVANGNGIFIKDSFSDEVLVHYSLLDSFGIFAGYGFASPERVAFSLPSVVGRKRQIIVKRDINFNAKRGSFNVPDFKIEGETLVLSCLMVGNSNFPKLSRGIFCHIMREAGLANPEEEFDIVLRQNWIAFLKLLEQLESYESEFIATLRKMVRYQLEAMSQCIGTREL